MKRKEKLPIRLDDIDPHWQRLSACGEEDDYDFSIMEKWNGIQERLKKTSYKMKLHIKEAIRQLAFSGDTMLSPPPRKVVTKGAPKSVRSTPKETSTDRIPSTWERVDSQFPDSQSSQTKISLPKRKSTRIGNYSCSQASTRTTQPFRDLPYITQMPKITRPYIENIVNVKGGGNCVFQVIARHMGMGHIVATCYNIVVVQLVFSERGICETCFLF